MLTVAHSPEAEVTPEEVFQAVNLVLLPKAKELWESWVESGLLTAEAEESGRYWKVNGSSSQLDEEERAESP
jgi:hypothetical protein